MSSSDTATSRRLRAAQEAGTARRDIDMRDLKAILAGCQATDVVIDGLRAQR